MKVCVMDATSGQAVSKLLESVRSMPGGRPGRHGQPRATQKDGKHQTDVKTPRMPCLQETFGAMAKTEKIFYILEQVRLCLDRKDYIRWAPVVVHYF